MRRRAIREKGIRRSDRKKALKKKKCLNRAEKRTRNRKKRNINRLIITLESLGPEKMNEKAKAMKSDVTDDAAVGRKKKGKRAQD
jgi:hypothetical protein